MGKFKKGDKIQVPSTIRGILPEIIGKKGRSIRTHYEDEQSVPFPFHGLF